jgi:transposase
MNSLGIDVHKHESQVAVLDEDGEVVDEVRVANANLDEIARQYAGSKGVIEATSNYFSIYDTLDEYLDVVVAHPAKTKAIGAAKVKNDRLDAKLLAQLRHVEMIAESYVPPAEIRERRALTRGRKRLVEKRTDFKNEVHALLDQEGITLDKKPFSVAGREALAALSLGIIARGLLDAYLAVIDTVTEQITKLERLINERAAALPEAQLLLTIPGVSYYSALLITAELGEINRFDSAKQVVSYAGLDPVIRESGDTRIEGGISKRGNSNLRYVLVQCANVAVHTCHDEYLSRFHTRLNRRKPSKVAMVATARKLLVSIYHMLMREEVYDPPGVRS